MFSLQASVAPESVETVRRVDVLLHSTGKAKGEYSYEGKERERNRYKQTRSTYGGGSLGLTVDNMFDGRLDVFYAISDVTGEYSSQHHGGW